MRRSVRVLAALVGVSLLAPQGAVAAGAREARPTASAVGVVDCPDVLVLAARGSGQRRNGPQVAAFLARLRDDLAGSELTVEVQRVLGKYDPAPVRTLRRGEIRPSHPYFRTIGAGRRTVVGAVGVNQHECPETPARLVLVGFSQGAMVMHRALSSMAGLFWTDALERVDGAVLIANGDRHRDGNGHLVGVDVASDDRAGIGATAFTRVPVADVPEIVGDVTWNVCTRADAVCDHRRRTFATRGIRVHLSPTYVGTAPVLDVADRVAQRVLLAPEPASSPLLSGDSGQPLSYQLQASSIADTLEWQVAPGAALPQGLTLDADGLVHGTPLWLPDGSGPTRVRVRGVAGSAVSGWVATEIRWRAAGATTRLSVGPGGAQPNHFSEEPAISGDGRYVAYESSASTLVAGDTNGRVDVFVSDRVTGETVRASVASDGTEGDKYSVNASVSGDGRYVAYQSLASNLVPDDSPNIDVFLWDRETGETSLVSVGAGGTQADGSSINPEVSGDGRYVVYQSGATNLVADADSNSHYDIYQWDRVTGETTRVSLATDGSEGDGYSVVPTVSSDGRFVAYETASSNLAPGDVDDLSDIYLWDRETGETSWVSVAPPDTAGDGYSVEPDLSADGRYVAYTSDASFLVPDDTNDVDDVFVWDRVTGETSRVSSASDGTPANLHAFSPSVSGDGRFVAYSTDATNLVSGGFDYWFDVFVTDRVTGKTTRVSAPPDGTEQDGDAYDLSISDDGRYVGFDSYASNLVPGDVGYGDVFVWDRDG